MTVKLCICFLAVTSFAVSPTKPQQYKPDWGSLKTHPNPTWFDDAKFGIYFHWGPYSVPEFGNEWYSRNMYRPDNRAYAHELKIHGPLQSFGYKDLIPLFRAERFDPDKWADLFVRAGARYAGPVAEHADGFSMWSSTVNPWNAAKMGPHRDVVGEMAIAIRKRNLKFISTFHHQWLWAWYPTFDKTLDTGNPKYSQLYGPPVSKAAWDYTNQNELIPDDAFCRTWEAKVKEVIDQYHPDLLYFDSRLGNIAEQYRKDFLAYYYNHSAAAKREVVVTYKDNGLEKGTAILDLERGRMADLTKFKWMTDDAMGWNSWSYVEGESYKSPNRLIDELVDIVSKNGNLLLDVGPRADGSIPEEVSERLLDIGKWLEMNGQAIYGTRPWTTFGEGPTKVQGGTFGEKNIKDFTSQDIRFTRKSQVLYAILMDWPNGPVIIKSLAKGAIMPFGKQIRSVELLGSKANVHWSQTAAGLSVQMPREKPGDYAFVLKISGS
ncbi:MAG: alpha-L-fucosidase [Acidobacteriota bacterium]|nr:alpha-L-fucosidase [Acidobacteriota bacterium]